MYISELITVCSYETGDVVNDERIKSVRI